MMFTFIATIVGEKAARPVGFALIAVVVLLALWGASCAFHRPDTTAQQQAEQTTRSGDAIANAAQNAVATISNRTVTDAVVDQATVNAQKEIDNAENDDDIRAAVIAGVCGQTSHHNDPACAVR